MILNHRNTLFSLTQTDENLSQEQIQGGMHWLNIHGVTAQSMTALQGGGPFLIAFVLTLGAWNYEIGLIAALAFIGEFMQIPGLYLLHVFNKRRAIAFITGLIYRLLWTLIILTPFSFCKKSSVFCLNMHDRIRPCIRPHDSGMEFPYTWCKCYYKGNRSGFIRV